MNTKNQLIRPYFLLALFLLLLNDFVLKIQFHNAFTGKLSDVAGLFAFSFFGSVFFSNKKNMRWFYNLTAVFFICWKSEFSEGFIHLINQSSLHFGRVVDYSDLWALLILPVSYCYRTSTPKKVHLRSPIFKYAIGLISCFAFMATSSMPTTVNLNLKSNKTYRSNFPKDSLIKKLGLFKKNDSVYATYVNIEDRNSMVNMQVVLNASNLNSTQVKLDSILSFTNRDNALLSIFDTSKRDIKYMKSLKLPDFEALFEKKKLKKLQE